MNAAILVIANGDGIAIACQSLGHISGISVHGGLHLVLTQRNTVGHLSQLAVIQNLNCGLAGRAACTGSIILLATTNKCSAGHCHSETQRSTLLYRTLVNLLHE